MKPYRRKLSREDADTGTTLITKGRGRTLPAATQEFVIGVAVERRATRVATNDCARVPAPHRHLHLEAGHFRHLLDFSRGAVAEIERDEGVCAVHHNG